jgi:hypothetical protein
MRERRIFDADQQLPLGPRVYPNRWPAGESVLLFQREDRGAAMGCWQRRAL